ncbi:MAG: transposase [Elusimicrobiota bacterium]|nr:transposase [Elusimicrobiota bacterium]
MAKRGRSIDEKMTIVLEGIKGESTVADICRCNGVSQTQYYKWRDKFIEGGTQALDTSRKTGDARLKAKVNELERALGRAVMKIEILKKNEEMLGR